jgi:hypothetical protein
MTGEYGILRQHDIPLDDKKVRIIRALAALGALSAGSARSAEEIARTAGVTEKQVRHYSYHAQAGGIVEVFERSFGAGHGYALSSLGARLLGI